MIKLNNKLLFLFLNSDQKEEGFEDFFPLQCISNTGPIEPLCWYKVKFLSTLVRQRSDMHYLTFLNVNLCCGIARSPYPINIANEMHFYRTTCLSVHAIYKNVKWVMLTEYNINFSLCLVHWQWVIQTPLKMEANELINISSCLW